MRRYLSISSTVILTLATLIGIPLKAYVNWVTHDPKCVEVGPKVWTPRMAKAYARGYMNMMYPEWNRSEWKALDKLWTNESHWNPMAYNHDEDRWTHKHAGGIPQMLNMKPGTPAPQQVARGLSYIHARYGKPSVAWAHSRTHGWY